jgi:signal peptidase
VRPQSRTLARITRAVAATAITLLLLAIVAVGVTGAVAGLRVVVVTSGSMEPTLRAGDVVLVRPDGPSGVDKGDLIVYRTRPDGPWTIHRVVDTRVVDLELYFVTKGDRNKGIDPDLTPANAVYGEGVARLPYFGQVLRWVSAPATRVLLAVVLAVVIVHELIIVTQLRRRMHARARSGG